MRNFLLIFFSTIALSFGLRANEIRISEFVEFSQGVLEGVQASEVYGDLRLGTPDGLSDKFDQAFLKGIWISNSSSSIQAFQGFIKVESNGNTTVGESGTGIRTSYLPVQKDLTFCVSISPEPGKTGSVYLTTSPWSEKYFSASFTKNVIGGAFQVVHNAISQTVLSLTSVPEDEIKICINKTGNSLIATAYSSAGTVTESVSNFPIGNVNYSVGLGMPFPTGIANNRADYSNFQVRPYVTEGSWVSAPIDRGGTPSTPGMLSWEAETPAGSNIEIRSATSPDGQDWSAWSDIYERPGPISSPQHRYIRFKVVMRPSSDLQTSPSLKSITLDQPDFEGDLLPLAKVKSAPNPARGGVIRFEYHLAAPAKAAKVFLSGPQGQILEEIDASAALGLNQLEINSQGLAQGVYFVRVRVTGNDGSEREVTKKVAVRPARR